MQEELSKFEKSCDLLLEDDQDDTLEIEGMNFGDSDEVKNVSVKSYAQNQLIIIFELYHCGKTTNSW